jgi:hypothetical protein
MTFVLKSIQQFLIFHMFLILEPLPEKMLNAQFLQSVRIGKKLDT